MTQTRLFIIIGASVLVFTIVLGMFFWWPKYQDFDALKKTEAGKKEALTAKIEYFKKLAETSSKLEEYVDATAKIDSAFPTDMQLAPLVLANFLIELCGENGLLADKTAWTGTTPDTGENATMGRIKFDISAKGDYSALKNFLVALNKNSRMLEVETLGFSSKEKKEGDQGNLFTYSIGITAPYSTK